MFVFCVVVFFALLNFSLGQQNISQVILANGYPLEVHEVTTSDGFILQLFRIPRGRNQSNTKGAVLLQHGLGSCCADWFLNLPYESLGFVLADAGYDVWVGNNRGNGYSMKHVKYNPSQPQFWYWTWDSFAAIDLPTEINYVLKTTRRNTLSYMGISQGTTQAFSGFSINPQLSQKVNLFVAFAPVAYVYNQRSELFEILATLDSATILELLGQLEFFLPDAIHKLIPGFCDHHPEICEYLMSLEMGPSSNLNASRLGFYSEYEIAPTSIWNMIHWCQGVRNNVFQHMDWGVQGNIAHYNQSTPPPYNLKNFPANLPYALFTGGNDYLADLKDVDHLLQQIPKPVQIVYQPTYSHIDYVLSEDAWSQIYPQVLNLLSKYNK